MTGRREIERMLENLENEDEDEVSRADAWREAITSSPESAEDLVETYREELEG